jgi:hypothetical protein
MRSSNYFQATQESDYSLKVKFGGGEQFESAESVPKTATFIENMTHGNGCLFAMP